MKAVHPLLKKHGFAKSSATWRKDQGESIAVFNVQKSQWGGGVYYVNLGIYLRALGQEDKPTENRCHVQVRLDLADPETVVSEAIEWFTARATLSMASALAESDSQKGLVFKEVRHAV